MKWNLGVSVSLKNCVEKQLHSSAFVEKIWKVLFFIHRFWSGFHFWLRPILDPFLIACCSILYCKMFSVFIKNHKNMRNTQRKRAFLRNFLLMRNVFFSFSEYDINAFKNCGFFIRGMLILKFNFWSFSIDCWTTSAIEKKSTWNSSEKSTFRALKKPHFLMHFCEIRWMKKHVFH